MQHHSVSDIVAHTKQFCKSVLVVALNIPDMQPALQLSNQAWQVSFACMHACICMLMRGLNKLLHTAEGSGMLDNTQWF